MKLSFKENLSLTDVKSSLTVFGFPFLLGIYSLTSLIRHCLYTIEFLVIPPSKLEYADFMLLLELS